MSIITQYAHRSLYFYPDQFSHDKYMYKPMLAVLYRELRFLMQKSVQNFTEKLYRLQQKTIQSNK